MVHYGALTADSLCTHSLLLHDSLRHLQRSPPRFLPSASPNICQNCRLTAISHAQLFCYYVMYSDEQHLIQP